MDIKIMTRMGRIINDGKNPNKCKSEDHPIFFYKLRIAFSKKTDLDEFGFIVDHDLIDKEIVDNVEVRSCELLSDDIIDTVRRFMKDRGISIKALKVTINPVLPIPADAGAFFEQMWCKDKKDIPLLTLL